MWEPKALGVACTGRVHFWRTSDPKPRFSALVADDYESKAVISDKKNQNGKPVVKFFVGGKVANFMTFFGR